MAQVNWRKQLAKLLYNGDLEAASNLLDGGLRSNPRNMSMKVELGKVVMAHAVLELSHADPLHVQGEHAPLG